MRLRWLAIAGQLIAIVGAHAALGLPLPLTPMLTIVTALALLNVATWRYLQVGRKVVSQRGVALQLLADLLALTALLYLSGGHANPFVFMLLPLLAVAATALSGWYTAAIALVAVVCYSLLLVSFVPLPVLDQGVGPWDPESLQLAGVWSCFVLSAAMILYFVLRTRQTLQEHQRAVVAARERAMRQEHLAALGSIAANTAHEMASPLATMKLLIEELDADPPASAADRHARVGELSGQLDRCDAALRQLLQATGEPGATRGSKRSLREQLERFITRVRQRHPNLCVDWSGPRAHRSPSLVWDRSLEQALMHLVDNAAAVSDRVQLDSEWTESHIFLRLTDNGPGIPSELRARLGRGPLTAAAGVRGQGLGVYLACATIERFGGTVAFECPEDGGTVATVVLPLPDLMPKSDETDGESLALARG